jgi:hypothetical protein
MIVGFTSYGQLGCTFLNWSLHYLSGDTRTWYEEEKSWIRIIENPLTKNDSHGFKKNHPMTISDWKKLIDIFSSYDRNNKFSFYGITLGTGKKWNMENFNEAISYSIDKKIKLIYLGTEYSTYNLVERSQFSVGWDQALRNKIYMKNIKEYFETVPNLESLTGTISKARDFLSLSMGNIKEPLDQEIIKDHSSHENFLFVNCHELLTNEKECLKGLFNFLNLEIDSSRMDNWLEVHSKWKENLLPLLNFYRDLPTILSSIINGVSHPLEQYRLDIFTEAIIQYELMKKHNDRLLISQLDQFPDDTKKLTPFLKSFLRKNEIDLED